MTRRRWVLVLALGVALAAAGVVVVLATPSPASFGWTAYSPLASTMYAPEPRRLSQLLAGGLLLAGGFVAGLAVASLRRRS